MKQKHESKNRWEYPNNPSGMLYKLRMILPGDSDYLDLGEARNYHQEIDATLFLPNYVLTDNFARVIWPVSLSDRILSSIDRIKTVNTDGDNRYPLPIQVEKPRYSAMHLNLFERIYAPKITDNPAEIKYNLVHENMISDFIATVIGMEQIIDCSSSYLRTVLGVKNLAARLR